jgi:glycerol uptake operon antiterminator
MLENLPLAVSTSVPMIILLDVDIKACSYPGFSKLLAKKPVFVHVDLMRGISADREGLLFLKEHVGFAGIVSTKNNIVRTARSIGLKTVQRTFLIDTASLEASLDTILRNSPDAIEFMPGLAVSIVPYLKSRLDIPIIMAGLIHSEADVQAAFSAGADAVSMSEQSLWEAPQATYL